MIVPDPEEFLYQTGLLFHINRTVLHPMGLSLTIAEEEVGEATVTTLVLHQTDDPNGFVFSEEDLRNLGSRYKAFLEERKPRILTRAHNLEYISQPEA